MKGFSKEVREITISWMEQARNSGEFHGYPEDDMDFTELDDEEIDYYYNEWVLPNRE